MADPQLSILYAALRRYHGSIKEVAQRSSTPSRPVSRAKVRDILIGRYADPIVVEAALSVLEDKEKEKAALSARLMAVLSVEGVSA